MPKASDRIMDFFRVANGGSRLMPGMPDAWYAIHEINLKGISQNACAARMRELTRQGKLECRVREGTRFKEWRLREEVLA